MYEPSNIKHRTTLNIISHFLCFAPRTIHLESVADLLACLLLRYIMSQKLAMQQIIPKRKI